VGEVLVRLEKLEDRVRRLRKSQGVLGQASKEEIKELLLEAEFGVFAFLKRKDSKRASRKAMVV